MSETTHTTWLVPLAAGIKFFPSQYAEIEHELEHLLRVELVHTLPTEVSTRLETAGIPYHMWQEGHLGAYAPSVRIYLGNDGRCEEVCCDEDGAAVVRVSLDRQNSIRFDNLASVLRYLTFTRAFLDEYAGGVDILELTSGFNP